MNDNDTPEDAPTSSSPSEATPSAADQPLTYRDAGVDIAAGNALVEAIKPLVAATQRPGADSKIGGFGGIFDLKPTGYSDPLLVAATDGVGTKLKIAEAAGRHDTIGIDLVAMCVNDLIVQGAEPLFFLDYFATGHLDVPTATAIVSGIAEGCRQAGCALIGGETAEMPGLYQGSDYDLAGFSIGAVDRHHLLPRGDDIEAGDILIGLSSSGIHSNGYSLVRKLIAREELAWTAEAPWQTGRTVADSLLTPTRIYVKPLLDVLDDTRRPSTPGPVKALAHITGGGLTENLPRVLPRGTLAQIDRATWSLPPVFAWLQAAGQLDDSELFKTFNCGIGMVVVVDADAAQSICDALADAGETATIIGEVATSQGSNPAPEVRYGGVGSTA